MNHTIIPPYEPKASGHIQPPMIYVKESVRWEYKQVVRDLENEEPLDEAELNALGTEGWEMSGVAQHSSSIYFYFKRLSEK